MNKFSDMDFTKQVGFIVQVTTAAGLWLIAAVSVIKWIAGIPATDLDMLFACIAFVLLAIQATVDVVRVLTARFEDD